MSEESPEGLEERLWPSLDVAFLKHIETRVGAGGGGEKGGFRRGMKADGDAGLIDGGDLCRISCV